MNSAGLVLFLLITASATIHLYAQKTSIVFATVGRSRYNFDIFSVNLPFTAGVNMNKIEFAEFQLTDGVSVNYNGFFPPNTSSLYSLLLHSISPPELFISREKDDELSSIVYVTERNGSSSIYVDFLPSFSSFSDSVSSRRVEIEIQNRIQISLLSIASDEISVESMKDRPSISGENLIYVSSHESSPEQRQSWTAVYSTNIFTGKTRRLTPANTADFSPSVSPSGDWTAVASFASNGWRGEVRELNTSIFVFRTVDGSRRKLVIDRGGWPCWGDDGTIYFHRVADDGWWSVYRAVVRIEGFEVSVDAIDRVTPAGFHGFTPATSKGAPGLLAVATRRPSSDYRHIEIINLRNGRNSFTEVTRFIAPNAHHYNPFISPDGKKVGYHRCRGQGGNGEPVLLMENIKSPLPESLSLFRIDGEFPSFSPDGSKIAYAGFPGLYVMNSDGSGERKQVFGGMAFATAWDWKREGVIYTSTGPVFAAETTTVDVVSVTVNEDEEGSEPVVKKLTTNGENNAFPSPSPDGNWVVFRSGRSGHKNLYIMDAVNGESARLQRLTEGPWTDTMCNWSPDGDWIAFASDRHNPGGGSFAIYMIHPNGTGLRRVVHSGDSGRTNHPWFSPDSKKLVFTSDYAGVSAEPIEVPHQFQPYGDIFTINIDGSNIKRLTHNSYEDGTPTWAPIYVKPADIAETLDGAACCKFDDCRWLNSTTNVGKRASATVRC